jgi:HTH-type transcriptional regulator, global nitrogen regulator NrpRI
MSPEIEKKTLLMLRILQDAQQPMGSRLISRQMTHNGLPLTERAVRYHLKLMDERGLTKLVRKRDGRLITAKGVEELGDARVQDKIGFAISRIESLAFRTTFNPKNRKGFLPINISLFHEEQFEKAREAMQLAFQAGLAVSELVAVAREGQLLGEVIVPKGMVEFATVCSIVINGVLLKNGIPQVKKGKPLRFVEIIYYSGSSLDPSEAFIRGKMTSVQRVIEEGEGKILANFREIPALSLSLVEKLIDDLEQAGIRGVLSVSRISEPVCQISMDMNKVGIILLGGLNPVACAQERGIEADNRAMSTLMAYQDLMKFQTLEKRSRR